MKSNFHGIKKYIFYKRYIIYLVHREKKEKGLLLTNHYLTFDDGSLSIAAYLSHVSFDISKPAAFWPTVLRKT